VVPVPMKVLGPIGVTKAPVTTKLSTRLAKYLKNAYIACIVSHSNACFASHRNGTVVAMVIWTVLHLHWDNSKTRTLCKNAIQVPVLA